MNTREPAESSPTALELRPAKEADLDFIRSLSERVFAVYGSYGSYLVDWFRAPGVSTFVGTLDRAAVGFLMLTAYPSARDPRVGVADLLAIAVDPEHQTRGIGSFLVRESLREAPGLPSPVPITEMHLSVAEGNARGQRLFGKFGFRLQPDRGIYPAGQTALHMIRRLSPLDSKQILTKR